MVTPVQRVIKFINDNENIAKCCSDVISIEGMREYSQQEIVLIFFKLIGAHILL